MKLSKNSFKEKASAMINPAPQSMKDLLENNSKTSVSNNDGQIHKNTNEDIHNSGKNRNQTVKFARFHVHIRQKLADKVFEAVFERKKSKGKIKKEASQRAIIEEALELYFNEDFHLNIK